MARCGDCGKDYMKNRACEHCGEIYCEAHWPLHMSLEKSNERLAREISRLWRHEQPSRGLGRGLESEPAPAPEAQSGPTL